MASKISLTSANLTRPNIHREVVGGIIKLIEIKNRLGGTDKTPNKARKPEVVQEANQAGQKLLDFSKQIKAVAPHTGDAKDKKEYLGRAKAAENIGKALLAIKQDTTIDKTVREIATDYIDASINLVASNGPDSEKVGYENLVALKLLGAKSFDKAYNKNSKIRNLETRLNKPEIKAITGEVKVKEEIEGLLTATPNKKAA